jgi:transcriptional regulatory protein RtcR
MLHGAQHEFLVKRLVADMAEVSPKTEVDCRVFDLKDPWDFEEVYAALYQFAESYPFCPDEEDYLIHITTGTHVHQICLFLLTEPRFMPGRLLQSRRDQRDDAEGWDSAWSVIDLDLSRYDGIARRFAANAEVSASFLKSGIETRSPVFNRMIEQIERVVIRSRAPVLLMGPTGAGKSQLARRIYELKRLKHKVSGALVEVNCATLRGDGAMSALFGHRKGAFTGAIADRPGLLLGADRGVLFLDEVGGLGLDEQAMLLRAIEEKRFLPVGSDRDVGSDFQLIAGTNRDLGAEVAKGRFREDLLARLNLWSFTLPGLAQRREDIEPNLAYELDRYAEQEGERVTFNRQARDQYLAFAINPEARWSGNFRDLAASITRMATLAPAGRIDEQTVAEECARLQLTWRHAGASVPCGSQDDALVGLIDPDTLDPFDRAQLAEVVRVCRRAGSLSEAGRVLFAFTRPKRKSANDADRLGEYLMRFGLDWSAAHLAHSE